MINNIDFVGRLKKVLEFHNLTASNFADTIGVQRSSISHILSGRNKPSLDFILKVTQNFKDVDLYWLLNGKGIFPKESFDSTPTPISSQSQLPLTESLNSGKRIKRVVVFYEDGTFEEYKKN